MPVLYDPLGHPIVQTKDPEGRNIDLHPTVPWYDYLEWLGDGGNSFHSVLEEGVTGYAVIVDELDLDGTAGAGFWFYHIDDGTNSRAGILANIWKSDGTLSGGHFQVDSISIGTTIVDVAFSFTFTSPTLYLKMDATTNTYTFSAKRVWI